MKYIVMNDELHHYLEKHNPLAHSALAKIKQITEQEEGEYHRMQISPLQGTFMHWIATLIGARRALEIGCFTGYSAVSVAAALSHEGTLISIEHNHLYVEKAKRNFELAGLSQQIEVRHGNARIELNKMIPELGENYFDFAFIDADKASMQAYFERCQKLVRPGGVILVDNVLWGGSVLNLSTSDSETKGIQAFNEWVIEQPKVIPMMLSLSDGIFCCINQK